MHRSKFFKLFPPPKFMVMKYGGLDISDDSIHYLEYDLTVWGMRTMKSAWMDIPDGIIDGGDIKDEKALGEILAKFGKENDLSYVKVSVPEEKAYLFQTDVPISDVVSIANNIEFKLEENVPLSGQDAVFYFDLLPTIPETGDTRRASVSVVPKVYIEHLITLLRQSNIFPMAFEVVPKAIARAIISVDACDTSMIVHVMEQKTGLYIISCGVVAFTSTIGWGSKTPKGTDVSALNKEISRVYSYWSSHGNVETVIKNIVLVGKEALNFEASIRLGTSELNLPVTIADVWKNSLDLNKYVPEISRDESLNYAVAAGLAMNS